MTLNRRFGYAFGAVYLLVGLAGFAVTSGLGLTATAGKDLIFFELNPLHNIVHLLVGVLLAGGAAAGSASSKTINLLVGVVYLLVGLVGFVLVGSDVNIIALNHPDNLLHLATAGLALGLGLRKEGVVATT